MAQIFISHSSRDGKYIEFLKSVFAVLGVKAIFEEYESMVYGRVSQRKIVRDILGSNAVFILATENVQALHHTRDWILWEAGVAKDKPIWVFEPQEQLGRISVLIPRLTHHVVFSLNDSWFRYVKNIAESYNASNALPAALTGGVLFGFVFNPLVGLIGAAGGVLATNKAILRPEGKRVSCGQCSTAYNVHLAVGVDSTRCPVCNNFGQIICKGRGVINAAK